MTHDQAEAMLTSDRIVVVIHGRIEQVDDPVAMYRRPRSRFVAGFIGRTNLPDGVRDGARIVFPGFDVPADSAPRADYAGSSFSVRRRTIVLHDAPPADHGRNWWVGGRIEQRAYLGEYWKYVVRAAGSELRLRVSTPPEDMHETGRDVWMEIDPSRIAPIPGPVGAMIGTRLTFGLAGRRGGSRWGSFAERTLFAALRFSAAGT